MNCCFETCESEGIVRPVFKIWALCTPFDKRDGTNCAVVVPNLPLCREHFSMLRPQGDLARGIFARVAEECRKGNRAPLDPDHIAIDCEHVLPNKPSHS